jgi:hypothetical protein
MAVPHIKSACTALNRLASFQHLSKFLQESDLTLCHTFSPAVLKKKIKKKEKE